MLILVTLIAAAGWVFTKLALAEFEPYTFLSLRFLCAALIISSLCWPALRLLSSKQVMQAAATGSMLGLSMLVWILAIKATPSIGEGSFIISLTVVCVPLINWLLFKQTPPRTLIIALIPALFGLGLLSLNFDQLDSGNFISQENMLFLISTIGFALHIIFTGKYAQSIPTMPLTSIQLLCVGSFAAIAGLLTETWSSTISSTAWGWLILSILIATSLRFSLQTKVLEHVNANNAAILMLLEPIWTTVLGAYFLNEQMNVQRLLGCGLILAGLLIYRAPLLRSLWLNLAK